VRNGAHEGLIDLYPPENLGRLEAWSLFVSRGATGPDGPAGATGARGLTGRIGATGPAGPSTLNATLLQQIIVAVQTNAQLRAAILSVLNP
jgi:hypothetical protein